MGYGNINKNETIFHIWSLKKFGEDKKKQKHSFHTKVHLIKKNNP